MCFCVLQCPLCIILPCRLLGYPASAMCPCTCDVPKLAVSVQLALCALLFSLTAWYPSARLSFHRASPSRPSVDKGCSVDISKMTVPPTAAAWWPHLGAL